ncbi:MAG: transcriptional regulator, TetR family [Nocardioides sp.]|nr:transcriptional regulator, TetR family [Nocardioides sp.]
MLFRPHDGAVTTTRIPQEERTRTMRLRLLEATVECIVERGYSGTSTTLVSERAGVSRGAQLHHFPTKIDLVVAAVEHVTQMRGAKLREKIADLAEASDQAAPSTPERITRLRRVLHLLAEHFTSPVFTAALELWVAARTDEALLAAVQPLEARVGRETHRLTVAALGADESRPGARELVQATLDLVRGLGLANSISDDAARRRRILDHWADVLDRELDSPQDVPDLLRSASPIDNADGTLT